MTDENLASSDPIVQLIRAAVRAEVRDAVHEAIAAHLTSGDQWLALRDVGVSVKTLRQAIKSGALPARKVGRNLMVRRADVDAWMERRPFRAPTPTAEPGADPLAAALAAGKLRVIK
ncbi:MAG: helix-turn-helix domain-containing protein [Polyangiaceae bacterium]